MGPNELSITTTSMVTYQSDGSAIVTVSIFSTWPNSPTLMRKIITVAVPPNKQQYNFEG